MQRGRGRREKVSGRWRETDTETETETEESGRQRREWVKDKLTNPVEYPLLLALEATWLYLNDIFGNVK